MKPNCFIIIIINYYYYRMPIRVPVDFVNGENAIFHVIALLRTN